MHYYDRNKNEFILNELAEQEADYLFIKPIREDILAERVLQIYCAKATSISKLQNNESSFFQMTTTKMRKADLFDGKCQENALAKVQQIEDINSFIEDLLLELKISPTLSGHAYLKECISVCIEDNRLLSALTKAVYPTVAKQFQTTSVCVERSMRHAIDKTWKNSDCNMESSLFLNNVFSTKNKPSCGDFLGAAINLYKYKHKIKNTLTCYQSAYHSF